MKDENCLIPFEKLQRARVEEGIRKWQLRIALPERAPHIGLHPTSDDEDVAVSTLPSVVLRGAFCAERDTIRKWVNCKHRVVDFHVTQMLTGHGCFGAYLNKIRRADSDKCMNCKEGVRDSPEHTMMDCPVWALERHELSVEIGDSINVSTMLHSILENREGAMAVSRFCNRVMLRKENEERAREKKAREECIRRKYVDAPLACVAKRSGGTWRICHDSLRKSITHGGKKQITASRRSADDSPLGIATRGGGTLRINHKILGKGLYGGKRPSSSNLC